MANSNGRPLLDGKDIQLDEVLEIMAGGVWCRVRLEQGKSQYKKRWVLRPVDAEWGDWNVLAIGKLARRVR